MEWPSSRNNGPLPFLDMNPLEVLDQIYRALRPLYSLGRSVDVALTSGSIENARAAATESTVRRKVFAVVMTPPDDRHDGQAIA